MATTPRNIIRDRKKAYLKISKPELVFDGIGIDVGGGESEGGSIGGIMGGITGSGIGVGLTSVRVALA